MLKNVLILGALFFFAACQTYQMTGKDGKTVTCRCGQLGCPPCTK